MYWFECLQEAEKSNEYKSATKVAKHLNISRNSVYHLLQKAA